MIILTESPASQRRKALKLVDDLRRYEHAIQLPPEGEKGLARLAQQLTDSPDLTQDQRLRTD
jgi:hypothetical protein